MIRLIGLFQLYDYIFIIIFLHYLWNIMFQNVIVNINLYIDDQAFFLTSVKISYNY